MADDNRCRGWVDMGTMMLNCQREPYHEGLRCRTHLTTTSGARVEVEWTMAPLSFAEHQANIINETGA